MDTLDFRFGAVKVLYYTFNLRELYTDTLRAERGTNERGTLMQKIIP